MKIDFKKLFQAELAARPFCVLDIGARGGIKSEWKQLLPHIKVIGFEPDAVECARLMASPPESGSFYCYPKALSSAPGESAFYTTKITGLSGLREPNQEFLSRFSKSNVAGFEVQNQSTLEVSPLDDVLSTSDAAEIDFIKVDVEGCAYEVLSGAERLLRESLVLGLRVELEFNQKYKGQHLFSDVCSLLSRHGYELVQIKPCFWKYASGLKTGGAEGMLVHGDFFYFLSFPALLRKISKLSKEDAALKLYKLAVFSCIYGQYDRAFEIQKEAKAQNLWTEAQIGSIEQSLETAKGLLARIPKLKEKGGIAEFFYYLFLVTGGILLWRFGLWEPSVRL